MTQQSDITHRLLKSVSRSFYLTLRVLPAPIRNQISLAYLLARAADSIADTDLLEPADRLEKLVWFREALVEGDGQRIRAIQASVKEMRNRKFFVDSTPEEILLQRLNECFDLFRSLTSDDTARMVEVLRELIQGMEMDLKRFPEDGQIRSLETFEELEQHTFSAAGCVGLYWTKMCCAHLPEFQPWYLKIDQMMTLGVRFGKALQWTNVLRDLPRDLARGRCYLPAKDLRELGMAPHHLKDPSLFPRMEGLYNHYLDHTLAHFRAAWEYVISVPSEARRVQLACIWPLWIGLETIAALRQSRNPLDPQYRIKIPRSRVYAIILRTVLTIPSEMMLDGHQKRLMRLAQGPSGTAQTRRLKFGRTR